MMSYEMEQEDFVRIKDAEIASLREELAREFNRRNVAEKEAEILMEECLRLKREVRDLRKQVQSWADEADADIQLAALRRAELEALEL
jgi:non-homologous end joining protein Ku